LTHPWQRAVLGLDRTTARLKACAPDDLARLTQVLTERQQAVEDLASLACDDPAAASPATVDRLSSAAAAGRELAIRLQLQTATLRRQLAAETARSRLLESLSSAEPSRPRRVNVRS
jgi:hypothetical protein